MFLFLKVWIYCEPPFWIAQFRNVWKRRVGGLGRVTKTRHPGYWNVFWLQFQTPALSLLLNFPRVETGTADQTRQPQHDGAQKFKRCKWEILIARDKLYRYIHTYDSNNNKLFFSFKVIYHSRFSLGWGWVGFIDLSLTPRVFLLVPRFSSLCKFDFHTKIWAVERLNITHWLGRMGNHFLRNWR